MNCLLKPRTPSAHHGSTVALAIAAWLLLAGGRPGVLAADDEWCETQVIRAQDARHPALVDVGGDLVLFWVGDPVVATGRYCPLFPVCGPPPAAQSIQTVQWPLSWVDLTKYQGKIMKSAGSARLALANGGSVYARLAMAGNGRDLIVVHPRHMYDSKAGTEAVVYRVSTNEEATWPLAIAKALAGPPLTALPYSLPSVRASSRAPPPDSDAAKWFIYHVKEDKDFSRLDVCGDGEGSGYYLCGEDHVAETIWVTHSHDGETWRDPLALAQGAGFPAIAARGQRVIVTYTDAGEFTYQVIWPDDRPRSDKFFWPPAGSLKYRLSEDGGKTWGEPKTLIERKEAISSRCVWAPDGTIWVAYVKSLGGTSALCLASSRDEGRTWTEPQQITTSKRTDRDPEIAIWRGKVVVAFSRCLRPGGWDNIWLWQHEANVTTDRAQTE